MTAREVLAEARRCFESAPADGTAWAAPTLACALAYATQWANPAARLAAFRGLSAQCGGLPLRELRGDDALAALDRAIAGLKG